jgi:hypothetical protein
MAMIDVLLLWSKSDGAGVPDEMVAPLLSVMKGAPGLRRLRVSEGDLMARGGPAPYSRVVEASFESLAEWMALVDVLNSQPESARPAEGAMPLVVFFDARDA